MDCCPPGFSVLGISQARVLEWVAISFSRGSSRPRDWTRVSCLQADSYRWVTWEAVQSPIHHRGRSKTRRGLLMTAQNKSTAPWSALQSLASPAFLPFDTVDLNDPHPSALPYPTCPSNFPPPCLPSAGEAITELMLNGHCNFSSRASSNGPPPGTLAIRDHSFLKALFWGKPPSIPGELAPYKFVPNTGQSSFGLGHMFSRFSCTNGYEKNT